MVTAVNELRYSGLVTTTTVTGTGYAPKGQLLANGHPAELTDQLKLWSKRLQANDTVLSEEDGKWTINGERRTGFLTLYRRSWESRLPVTI